MFDLGIHYTFLYIFYKLELNFHHNIDKGIFAGKCFKRLENSWLCKKGKIFR